MGRVEAQADLAACSEKAGHKEAGCGSPGTEGLMTSGPGTSGFGTAGLGSASPGSGSGSGGLGSGSGRGEIIRKTPHFGVEQFLRNRAVCHASRFGHESCNG